MQTVYSLHDLYDLLEVAAVDAHNRVTLEKAAAARAERERRGF